MLRPFFATDCDTVWCNIACLVGSSNEVRLEDAQVQGASAATRISTQGYREQLNRFSRTRYNPIQHFDTLCYRVNVSVSFFELEIPPVGREPEQADTAIGDFPRSVKLKIESTERSSCSDGLCFLPRGQAR